MKELAFVLALIFVIAVVLSLRAIALRIKALRSPWMVDTIDDGHTVQVVLVKPLHKALPIGETLDVNDDHFEDNLYVNKSEAKYKAMALNNK